MELNFQASDRYSSKEYMSPFSTFTRFSSGAIYNLFTRICGYFGDKNINKVSCSVW